MNGIGKSSGEVCVESLSVWVARLISYVVKE